MHPCCGAPALADHIVRAPRRRSPDGPTAPITGGAEPTAAPDGPPAAIFPGGPILPIVGPRAEVWALAVRGGPIADWRVVETRVGGVRQAPSPAA